MCFIQGQNIIFDKKYSKENRSISKNANALGRINSAKSGPYATNLNSSKRQNHNNYSKYTINQKSYIINGSQKRDIFYYEYTPSKLMIKNIIIKKL